MEFSRFTDCPPRAPVGRSDAVYGSFDHLIIVLGRLVDFSVRDRHRKITVVKSNGGHWRPAPGIVLGPPQGPPQRQSASGPSAAPKTKQRTQSAAPPQVPDFYGMAPPRAWTGMHSKYETGRTSSIPMEPQAKDPIDIADATQKAIEEWTQIRSALLAFESMLGKNFQPLSAEYQQPMQTPFGPALFYRSYDIACLWCIYNMAWIILARSHPHMPPHAHVAAGVAAYQTRNYANEIGRIACGIIPPPESEPLNPTLGGAFSETCVPLFFAGVQYQDPAQRDWIITRLFEVERRCGYDTAGLVGNGIQTAWYKAFKAGRGPPYERRWNTQAHDERLSGAFEHKDTGEPPKGREVTDRRFVHTKAQARLHWALGVIGMEEND